MEARWKPNVTVAAVIAHDGRFLMVEEESPKGLRLNNPAGHLDCGESLATACARETLEETSYHFEPTALIGIYLSRQLDHQGSDISYLRFAFAGELGIFDPERTLDTGIVRTLWMSADEIRASAARHRSPLVLQCIEDFLTGRRYPMDLIRTDTNVFSLPSALFIY
jgi:ADP-ribose pyrophosphatase YjhB (NUDIX family)